jgi:hypothetical protein
LTECNPAKNPSRERGFGAGRCRLATLDLPHRATMYRDPAWNSMRTIHHNVTVLGSEGTKFFDPTGHKRG